MSIDHHVSVPNDLRALIENFPAPLTLADVRLDDVPLVCCNAAFEELTGYSRDEFIGRNCRFLQGDETDQPELERIRTAVSLGHEEHAVLKNFRKDATPFDNLLFVFPILESGTLRYFLGSQFKIEDRRVTERSRRHADVLERTLDAVSAENRTVRRQSKQLISEAVAASIRFHMQHRAG